MIIGPPPKFHGTRDNLVQRAGRPREVASGRDVVLQFTDLHGDILATVPVPDTDPAIATPDLSQLRFQAADEYGAPTDLTTGTTKASTGAAPAGKDRYSWLGGAQRSSQALAGVILMGVRLYDPATGRFWSTDSVPGGNATAYDYCSADPVNCTDLDGRWSWKGVLKVVAIVGEVAAFIPGPVGAAAGAISAGAYAATGNRERAAQMAVVAVAALVGGAAVVKAGMKLAPAMMKAGKPSPNT